jgi:hypothetical protein
MHRLTGDSHKSHSGTGIIVSITKQSYQKHTGASPKKKRASSHIFMLEMIQKTRLKSALESESTTWEEEVNQTIVLQVLEDAIGWRRQQFTELPFDLKQFTLLQNQI